ncbi:hypothetical protein [Sutcliffiella halmapala]|uniref:hypothetical protein n=1 Tax=Sutcliffiella halmapala TaxID=79882 RepID=UPI0011172AE9|nr:hypothetical protein [Sutcliffiella halmapala]
MKKKRIITILVVISLLLSIALIWLYHHKIIEGQYNKLTISKMGDSLYVIHNKEEINRIMRKINTSPRTFHPTNGFRYDHLPHGTLLFENDNELVEIEIVFQKGNVLTRYWEIETNLEFGREVE